MLQTLQFFGDGERCKLDDTARKVALLCGNELHFVSTTGLLNTSGRLRAILLSAGLLLRTDIQELESLNSMLKIAMQRANTTTISLELLSSRVCIRKTIASLTGSSNKVKIVKPIAARLANTIYLVWQEHRAIINDTCRWAPTADVKIPANDPKLWNPSSLPNKAQKWAIPFHKKLIKSIDSFADKCDPDSIVFTVAVPEVHINGKHALQWRWRFFLSGERSRSIAMLMEIQQVGVSEDSFLGDSSCDAWNKCFPNENSYTYTIKDTTDIRSSLLIIADLYSMLTQVKSQGHQLGSVFTYLVPMRSCLSNIDIDKTTGIASTILEPLPIQDDCEQICEIRKRKEYVRRKQTTAAGASGRGDPPASAIADVDRDSDCGSDFDNDMDDDDDDDNIDDNDGEEDDVVSAWGDLETTDDQYIDEDMESMDEATELNSSIAKAGMNMKSKNAKCKPLTDAQVQQLEISKDTSEKASSSRTVMMNVHDLEEEAWIQDSVLGSGMIHATVTVHNVEQCPLESQEPDSDSIDRESLHALKEAPTHQLDVAMDRWVRSIELTAEALRCRFDDSQTLTVGHNSNISLVLSHELHQGVSDMQVLFVQWSNSVIRMGRHLSIDENDGVVCPVYFMQQAVSYRNSEIIHPAVGVCVRRAKKGHRPVLPPHIRRLYDIYSTSIKSGTSKEDPSLVFESIQDDCLACGTPCMFQRGCCQKFWHSHCADAIRDHIQHAVGSVDLDMRNLNTKCLPLCWLDDSEHSLHLKSGSSSSNAAGNRRTLSEHGFA